MFLRFVLVARTHRFEANLHYAWVNYSRQCVTTQFKRILRPCGDVKKTWVVVEWPGDCIWDILRWPRHRHQSKLYWSGLHCPTKCEYVSTWELCVESVQSISDCTSLRTVESVDIYIYIYVCINDDYIYTKWKLYDIFVIVLNPLNSCLLFDTVFGCCWTAPWPKQWEHDGFFTSSKLEANRYGSSARYHWECHHSWRWPTDLRNFGCALSQVGDKGKKIRIMHATPRFTSACTLGLPTVNSGTGSQREYVDSDTATQRAWNCLLPYTQMRWSPWESWSGVTTNVSRDAGHDHSNLPCQNWEALSWL